MLALEVFRSVPRFAASRVAGRRMPGLLVGATSPLRLITREDPEVRAPGWARLAPRLSGICGSDLGVVTGSTSLYFAGLVSLPFVPGHEVVAELLDDCDDLPRGTRVVLDPVLACAARGLPACGPCAAGRTNRCERITVGHVAPGLQTGYCADTGGGWGERMVAHRSQLHPVPDTLDDERAVLVEPLACAVQLARRAAPAPGDRVLVSGAGIVGLFAVLALRELTPAADITVVAKHGHQAALAKDFGATSVVGPGEAMRAVRRETQALQVRSGLPERLAGDLLLGGVDVAIDAVGSTDSLDLALRSTRDGGRVVLAGMPPAHVDLSPAWMRELEVVGSYASAGDAFDVALRLAEQAPLAGLVSARYPLHQWREAIDHASAAGRLGSVKICFDARRRR